MKVEDLLRLSSSSEEDTSSVISDEIIKNIKPVKKEKGIVPKKMKTKTKKKVSFKLDSPDLDDILSIKQTEESVSDQDQVQEKKCSCQLNQQLNKVEQNGFNVSF